MERERGNHNTGVRASVLVIAYNQEGSVGRAIESVLAQRCSFPFEVVVADDASTDGTRRVCEEYARRFPEKVRLLPAAPNRGVAANYFAAFAAARGEYVADCAGDDEWGDPSRLQRQTEWLDAHPGDVAVISDWDIVKDEETLSSRSLSDYAPYRRHIPGEEFRRRVLGATGTFPLLSAILYRREPVARLFAAEPSRLLRDEWRCEDLPLSAFLGSAGDIGYLPLTASRYNQRGSGGVSRSNAAGRLFDFYAATTECVLDLCAIYGLPQDDLAEALCHRVRFLTWGALATGRAARRERLAAIAARCGDVLGPGERLRVTLVRHGAARILLRAWKRLTQGSGWRTIS